MRKALAIIWAFNIWDAVATWYAVVVAKFAYEVNPLMARAIKAGPAAFFGIKIVAMTALLGFIWWYVGPTDKLMAHKNYKPTWALKFARVMVWTNATVYVLLGLWHVAMLALWWHRG